MPDLYEVASSFRAAIEDAVSADEIREMVSFPSGCCSYASDLLQRYLVEQFNFFTWYMSGEYGFGAGFESHTWLETLDHRTVIDITGDQYKNKKLKFTKAVYVGSRENGFHNRFKLHEPVAYSIEHDPFVAYSKDDLRYDTVLQYLKSQ